VHKVLSASSPDIFFPRMTHCAVEELVSLRSYLEFTPLYDRADRRISCCTLSTLRTRTPRIWNTRLPAKVRLFGWLLYHKRLNSQYPGQLVPQEHPLIDESNCEFCPGALETDDHILLNCPRAQAIWADLNITVVVGAHTAPCWSIGCDLPLSDQTRTDAALALLWNIWKARNARSSIN
jgi:hypothetical protein